MKRLTLLAVVASLLVSVSCSSCGGGSDRPTSPVNPGPGAPTGTPSTSPKIYFVIFENHSYGQIVGNGNMPFLNSLITSRAMADNYYANTHPSIGNYFMLTTGQIITNDDSFSGTVNADNLVRELTAAGKSWRVYAESLPSVGYLGGNSGPYVKRHNPFAYFSDVVNSAAQAQNIVPLAQFSGALSGGATADFNYVLPNQNNNMHDCPAGMMTCTDADKERAADAWLQANVAPILNNADFQQRGLLIITLDESVETDSANGGGHIVTVLAGPKAKDAYRSNVFYQHQSLLRLVCEVLGCTVKPGASAAATPMNEFLK
jgi:acid phosphatase